MHDFPAHQPTTQQTIQYTRQSVSHVKSTAVDLTLYIYAKRPYLPFGSFWLKGDATFDRLDSEAWQRTGMRNRPPPALLLA